MATFYAQRKKALAFTMVLAMLMTMLLSSIAIFASSVTPDAQAHRDLTIYVQSQMSNKEYAVDGGGTIEGRDLFDGSPTDGYDLNEDEFQTLTSAAQAQVVEDIAANSNAAIEETDTVSESTVQNWWRELQTKDGVGSKFLNEILKNTKPDFVTANAIYQPFSGLVGTILGVIAVLLMAFLGIVIVCDISYIALPPVRNLVADDDGDRSGHKIAKSKIFSHDAIYAVQCAENNTDGGSGGGKQALGIYLKRRVVMLIILGICLMYLVQGQVYTFVGWLLTLLNGFLGF